MLELMKNKRRTLDAVYRPSYIACVDALQMLSHSHNSPFLYIRLSLWYLVNDRRGTARDLHVLYADDYIL